jgi:hemerythrin superfamily protein
VALTEVVKMDEKLTEGLVLNLQKLKDPILKIKKKIKKKSFLK